MPVSETVTACLEELDKRPADTGPQMLTDALAWALKAAKDVDVAPDEWDRSDLPAHLSMNISVVDEQDTEIASGRDLQALRDELGMQAQQRFAPENPWEREGLTAWEGFELPESVTFDREGQKLTGYPALVDAGESVTLTLMDTPEKAKAATRHGVNRLVRLELKDQMKFLERSLPGFSQLALLYAHLGNAEELRSDLIAAIVDRAVWAEDAPVREPPCVRGAAQAGEEPHPGRRAGVRAARDRGADRSAGRAQDPRRTARGEVARGVRGHAASASEPDLRRLHRPGAVHAAAAVSALPQGDGAAAGEDPELRRSGIRSGPPRSRGYGSSTKTGWRSIARPASAIRT